jgi:predicted DNA-binding transcriptional regulator AlpA
MQDLSHPKRKLEDLETKEYLRPFEIKAVFGIDKSTLYRWMKDKEFPKPLKPSRKVTLINREAFKRYLELRTQKRATAAE